MGLTPKELRKFTYKYARANDITCPPTWISNETAGGEWFSSFMKWKTGLSMATGFNETNFNCFLDSLSHFFNQYAFESTDI